MGFHREQQFFGQSFLLLLLMVGFGGNLRVHFSECCANEQENVDLVFGMVTILSEILGTVVGDIS
jgi:hypothetical protein